MDRKKKLDITPVFNHRKSIALVDTAEDLVDSLDNLSVCLRHIEEKYAQVRNSRFSPKIKFRLAEFMLQSKYFNANFSLNWKSSFPSICRFQTFLRRNPKTR